jgi:hypothetical protein
MVRCADCGLLCFKDDETRTFGHVDAESRKTGRMPLYKSGDDKPVYFQHMPYCFALAADLLEECTAKGVSPPVSPMHGKTNLVLEVIEVDRDCASFVKWRSGSSPKEHRDMQQIQEQRERDLAWQEQRRREDLEWQSRQASLAEERWEREHRLQRNQLVIVGIVGTVILAVSQIVAALIQVYWSK